MPEIDEEMEALERIETRLQNEGFDVERKPWTNGHTDWIMLTVPHDNWYEAYQIVEQEKVI